MATEVLMPKLGATMENGKILMWHKKEGDSIINGEILLEVMTDKVNIEVEAEVSGILLKTLFQQDEDVPVMQVIAYIGNEGEGIPGTAAQSIMEAKEQVPSAAGKLRRTPAARKLASDRNVDLRQVTGSGPLGRIHRSDVEKFISRKADKIVVTPLARKMAEDQQLVVDEIKGTGIHGKITSQDVQSHLQQKSPETSKSIEAKPIGESAERVRVEGIRKVVGRRMAESAFVAPHVTLVSEADMSQAMKLREQLLPSIEKRTGFRLSYTEMIMKAVAHSLRNHPMVNASLQGDYIMLNRDVHIGLAVAVPNGLLVPVIRDVDKKGLAALTEESKTLGKLARDQKLGLDQMTGGTFTISNLGMYAVDSFTPIINQPESAILGVGRIHDKAVGVDGSIELRPMMTLSLSFDHRVIDGAPAAAFLTEIKGILENPLELLL
ncbi:pyruvate dehydrogenase E2 component (dihydrolipoamide acetyltransferase) [Paenibacillus sp. yr247]|uniref:2-oxo acid dehydrogenase subunit E2 n=1 Tax=Paenibacillus sp. yr247 TaxID=1761880 RepID=UPI000886C7E4|nr:2-oxo acid dehydrogenase subunit E2 [Paenibacillus sp. yr247]SDO48476.1 pyruvate dehydrogenase E2 component (dihydrolipoamide acetyltransferase) [Paenibacillus sp. yr247]